MTRKREVNKRTRKAASRSDRSPGVGSHANKGRNISEAEGKLPRQTKDTGSRNEAGSTSQRSEARKTEQHAHERREMRTVQAPAAKSPWKTLLSPIVVSILVVYLLIVTVYMLNYAPKKIAQASLARDKERIVENFVSYDISRSQGVDGVPNVVTFIVDNNLDKEKLKEFAAKNYDEIKAELGLENDFCIHFEDDKGNVIFINSTNNITGIGSPKAVIGNYTCFSRR